MMSEEGIIAGIKAWYINKYENNQVLTVFLTGMLLMMIVCTILSLLTGGQAFAFMIHPNPPYVFMDHFSMVADASNHPYSVQGEIYPPLGICFYAIIGHFTIPFVNWDGQSTWDLALAMRDTSMPAMVFMILIIALIISFYMVYQKFVEKDIGRAEYNMLFITVLFSYPVLFGISTGNYIFLTVLCCVLYIYGYDSENKWIRYLSYIALGVAAGTKITPAFLAVLTLKRKGWLELGKCVVVVSALLMVPFVFTDGDPIWYVRHVIEYASSVPSSFGFLNINDLLDALGLDIYGALAVEILVLGAVLMLILMDEEMEKWEEATILGGMLMLIFSVSVSYTLLYLELGLMILLATHKKFTDKGMMLCIICFIGVFCMMPGFELGQKYVGTIKMIFMLVMLFYLFFRSIKRQVDHHKSTPATIEEPRQKSSNKKVKAQKNYNKKKTNKDNNSKKNKNPRRTKSPL